MSPGPSFAVPPRQRGSVPLRSPEPVESDNSPRASALGSHTLSLVPGCWLSMCLALRGLCAHDSSRPVCPCATFPRWHTFTGTDRSLSAVDTWYLTSLSNSRIPSWLCGHSPVVIVLTLHVTFKHRHHALPCPRSGSHRGGSALHCPTLYSPS